MIEFKNILAAVKITNNENWKIHYLLKNFDRFLDEEKSVFLEEKFLTSHSWFFQKKYDEKNNYNKKIYHKKNFYLEKNFSIEYLYLDNFFDKNWIFLRQNEKNLERFSKNFTTEIRSNFFFTEASFFYLLNEKFETISTYRISPKNFKIWLNDFKDTELKNIFKWKFFIYPFQILEKEFLNYITEKIDSYLWNEKTFSKEEFLNPVKNTNYVNFFSQKYEFFSYLKFKEILEEIFLEKFWKDLKENLKKDYSNLRKRFLLENFNDLKNLEDYKNYSEENKKSLKKIILDKKIIRFEDEFWYKNTKKENKEFWFLEYKINENLNFKYIFWDKTEKNNSHFLEEDFSKILWKNFRNNSEKLTPDITLEILNNKKNIKKKIFFDVKFSSFKDFDLKLDYPNPKYFKSDLHKYRKIWYENEKDFHSKAEKIFVIYPWNITEKNFENFKKMNHLIEKSYNMILIPIHKWFWERKFLREYIKEIFIKEIDFLIEK